MTGGPEVPRRGRRVRLGAALGLFAAAAAVGWWLTHPADLPQGISPEEYERAARKYRELHGQKAGRLDTLSLAGELAVADGRLATAAACFAAIPDDDRRYGASARLQAGQVLLKLNRAREAESSFREFLSLAARRPAGPGENVAAARRFLSYVLSVELRFEERKSLLADLHADRQAGVFDSKQFYFPHLLLWHSSTGRRRLPDWLAADPSNPLLREAEGRYLTAEGKLDEARAWLEELQREFPERLTSAAALLECLFERDDWDNFAALARLLPEYAPSQPWLLTRMRGEWALHDDDWEGAVRNFQRVLEDDPTNPWCHMGLARAYAALNRPDDRDQEQRHSLVLSRIRVHLVNVEENQPEALLALAAQCEEIGFEEAAETFRRYAQRP